MKIPSMFLVKSKYFKIFLAYSYVKPVVMAILDFQLT